MRWQKHIIILSIACMLIPAISVFGQNTKVQESRRERLRKEIELIDEQLRQNTSKSRSALSELSLVRKKISARNELIAESDKEIRALSLQINEKQKEIDSLQARIDTLSEYYSRLVLRAYKNRDSKVWYMYILASDNVWQAFRRIGYLRSLSAQMNTQAKKINEAKDELEEVRKGLVALKDDAQALKDRRVKEMTALKSEEQASQGLVNRLKKDNAKYRKELDYKRRQIVALNREIERIIREATRGSGAKSSSGSKQKIDYTLDKEFAKNKGKLPWPAEGPVVEKFGQHNHPVFRRVKLPFNNGISIALKAGDSVKAVFDGVVKQIVMMPGYNQCVLVQHGNYFSFYCKLDRTSVKAGDKIKTGDIIGTVGTMAGISQLHFQIWKGTSPQNPENWLR